MASKTLYQSCGLACHQGFFRTSLPVCNDWIHIPTFGSRPQPISSTLFGWRASTRITAPTTTQPRRLRESSTLVLSPRENDDHLRRPFRSHHRAYPNVRKTPSHSGNFLPQSRHAATATKMYVSYGMMEKLFEACSAQADYRIPQAAKRGEDIPKTASGEDLGVGDGWWYTDLGLLPTFSTWSQVTFLHMYLLTVRLRASPSRESLQTHFRHLIDHFSHNAEHRMVELHRLTSRGIRNKYLKDLFIQWRGILAAYDEGIIKGDAVLGAAVWRNLWKASPTDPDGGEVDWTKVARVVAYIRRVLSELVEIDEGDLVFALACHSDGRPAIFGPRDTDKRLARER